jgi:hypothetical protein
MAITGFISGVHADTPEVNLRLGHDEYRGQARGLSLINPHKPRPD